MIASVNHQSWIFFSPSYSGNANYNAATSNAVNVLVMQPATVTASANPASLNPLQSFTVTASVSGVNGILAPTGLVSFDAYGPGGSDSGVVTLVNGSASFTFPGQYWNPGTVLVDVGYVGDSTYARADVVVPVTITTPFTLSATSVVIAAPGATTGNTSTITVTPTNGFTGQVYFSCTIEYYPPGAQHLPICNLPASINITGTSAVMATMTISSTPTTTVALGLLRGRLHWFAAQLGTIVAAFFLLGIPGPRRGRGRLPTFVLALALLGSLAGCGGGTGSGGGHQVPGTTPGTYSFMVEGSFRATIGASQPQIAMVNVTIQ
jgi:trimeric autotransporter adhesin